MSTQTVAISTPTVSGPTAVPSGPHATLHVTVPPTHSAGAAISTECTECSGAIQANVALAGEILACPDCGAELEVRSLQPLVLALAPEVEEDWGE
jgi:alpha-aminoadipate/glutamate carrier protein LysW